MPKVIFFLAFLVICYKAYPNSIQYSREQIEQEINMVFLNSIYEGEYEVVKILLDMGADVNSVDAINNSALIYAVQGGYIEIIELLLANGADIEHNGRFGRTPLIEAARFNHFQLTELLILNGASIDKSDLYGNTALFYAVASGNFYLVDMLIFYGADVNHENRKRISPIHIASWYGYLEIAGLLIESGADIQATDQLGNTALLAAVMNENIEMAWYLVESGADILALNNQYLDIFSVAAFNKDYEMFEFLMAYEIIPDFYSNKFKSPIGIAYLNNDKKLRKLAKANNNFTPEGLYFSHVTLEPYLVFNSNEFMVGFQAGVLESRTGVNTLIGYESRPLSRRVLMQKEEGLYYQYWEKRRVLSLALRKQHVLFRMNNILLGIHYGLKGAYTYGSYRGSSISPESKLLPIPFGGLHIGGNSVSIIAGYYYMNYGQFDIPAHRFNIGVSFSLPLHDTYYNKIDYSVY